MSTEIQLETENTIDSTQSDVKLEKTHQPILGFLFFGFVGLLCFNYFIQVQSYLEENYAADFTFYANIVYGLSNNIGQLIIIFYGSKLSFSQRIYSSCIMLAAILIAFPVLAALGPSAGVGMGIGILLVFGLGFFNAIIQSAGFGLAGICSGKAMEYFSLGQAVCGLVPWPMIIGFRAMYTAIGVSNIESATAFTALGFASLITLLMLPFYKYSLSQTETVRRAIANLETMKTSTVVHHRSKLDIIKSTLPLALSVWFVLYVTFVVFPSQPLKWTPSFDGYPANFYISMIIYVFQVFDVVGRYLPAFGVNLGIKQIKIGSLGRALLIPLFYLATYKVSFFANDITRIVIMALLATTNGLVLTWAMIRGPSQVHKDEADVASYTMSFFLVNGIFFGNLTAWIVKLITGNA
jgi:hypothetical protein